MPRCRVVDDRFDWNGDFHPVRAPNERIIYELHVGGYTRRHPDVPVQNQGKFLGLTQQQVIDHLKSMGVTTLELLPVQSFVDDRTLVQRGLKNYWGYNTLAYFAPDPRFGVQDPVQIGRAHV